VVQAATLTYAIIDGPLGGPWQLQWSNAGHPPPLLVSRDGKAEFLEHDADPLLGVAPQVERTDHTHPLPPCSTLIFYTDGLVEARASTVDDGLAALAAGVAPRAGDPVDVIVDDLVKSAGSPDDDVAVLAVRIPAAGEGAR
jgi:serine phosphatase RsbU (regulator of sigma subunit)